MREKTGFSLFPAAKFDAVQHHEVLIGRKGRGNFFRKLVDVEAFRENFQFIFPDFGFSADIYLRGSLELQVARLAVGLDMDGITGFRIRPRPVANEIGVYLGYFFLAGENKKKDENSRDKDVRLFHSVNRVGFTWQI
jgi:hypothetical protein